MKIFAGRIYAKRVKVGRNKAAGARKWQYESSSG